MDLSELANHFEAESKSENIRESVTHDWMVENTDQLVAALLQYVQTNHLSTYAQVGTDPTIYQEQMVAKGLQATVATTWGKLNEDGECRD